MGKSQKIKPHGNRVVVERQESKTSKGGILLPETAKEKPRQGKVVAVGPGKMDEKGRMQPVELKVGDEVRITRFHKPFKLMRNPKRSYYEVLRRKLKWGEL